MNQATRYASQHIRCLSQAMIYCRFVPGGASGVKMVGMTETEAPISLDGVAVHPDSWCVCLCYLHFAPENPEDGKIYLLVPAHPDCPGLSPESCKMVVYVYIYVICFGLVNQSLIAILHQPIGCQLIAQHHG